MGSKNFLLVLLLIPVGISPGIAQTSEDTVISHNVNFGFGASHSFIGNQTVTPPTLPDVLDYINTNLTDLSIREGYTYSNSSEELDILNYDFNINITQIDIIDDHDIIGAGEIYFLSTINANKTRYPETGTIELNSGESLTSDFNIFADFGHQVLASFEVMDEDAIFDDSLGVISFTIAPTTSNGSWYIDTVTGDARIYFDILVFQRPINITVGNLITSVKPYLHIDDESYDNIPDVYGRLSRGNDSGIDAYVFQFIFYWDNETSPTILGEYLLHENDFEAVYLYYDSQDLYEPYRVVFNNWHYLNLLFEGTPEQSITVLDTSVSTSFDVVETITIDSVFQPLLGLETVIDAKYRPYSSVTDWDYGLSSKDVRVRGWAGSFTMEMTVDTSFHTFDLGPGGVDEIAFNYPVYLLTDDALINMYKELNSTFTEGTHLVSALGIDIPKVSPFPFDITSVFEAPYIITAYDTIAESAGDFERARSSRLEYEYNLTVGVELVLPSTINITLPSSTNQGTSFEVSMDFETNEDELEIIFPYSLDIYTNFSFWFTSSAFDFNYEGVLSFDFINGYLEDQINETTYNSFSILDSINIADLLAIRSLTINPNIIGEIASANIDLSIWKILSWIIDRIPSASARILAKIVEFFIDDLVLSFELIVSGIVSTNLRSNDPDAQISNANITFNEGSLSQTITVTPSQGFHGEFQLIFSEFIYGLEFLANWSMTIDYTSIINNLIPDQTFHIGEGPSFNLDLLRTDGISVTLNIVEMHTETTTTTNDNSSSTSTDTSGSTNTNESTNTTENTPNNPAPMPLFWMVSGIIIGTRVIGRKKIR